MPATLSLARAGQSNLPGGQCVPAAARPAVRPVTSACASPPIYDWVLNPPTSQPATYRFGMIPTCSSSRSAVINGSIDTDEARRMTCMSRSARSPPQVKVMPERTSAALKGGCTTGNAFLCLAGCRRFPRPEVMASLIALAVCGQPRRRQCPRSASLARALPECPPARQDRRPSGLDPARPSQAGRPDRLASPWRNRKRKPRWPAVGARCACSGIPRRCPPIHPQSVALRDSGPLQGARICGSCPGTRMR